MCNKCLENVGFFQRPIHSFVLICKIGHRPNWTVLAFVAVMRTSVNLGLNYDESGLLPKFTLKQKSFLTEFSFGYFDSSLAAVQS